MSRISIRFSTAAIKRRTLVLLDREMKDYLTRVAINKPPKEQRANGEWSCTYEGTSTATNLARKTLQEWYDGVRERDSVSKTKIIPEGAVLEIVVTP